MFIIYLGATMEELCNEEGSLGHPNLENKKSFEL